MSQHPLDPLTAKEITRVGEIVRAHPVFTDRTHFSSIALAEPGKPLLKDYARGGAAPDREALVVLYDREHRMVREVLVSLTRDTVASTAERSGQRPRVQSADFEAVVPAIKEHPDWLAAMRRRGLTDPALIEVHPWPPGYNDERDDYQHRRVAKALTFVRPTKDDNPFARPVEGVVVTADLDTAEVLRVEDVTRVPVGDDGGRHGPQQATREGVRRLDITQPDGPSFTLDGYLLQWQNWSIRVGFNDREGLVLHQISYNDQGRRRSVIHRASLSEMWVPYGDPAPLHRNKAVFDEGEVGLGKLANSLVLGCDCLGEIRYLDGVTADWDGKPTVIENAICIHEEDTGIAWKHTGHGENFEQFATDVRRGRRLVVSSFSTLSNYDYGFFWYFHTDGSVEFEVKLTGIISAGGVPAGEVPASGTVVAPGVYGPHHQHAFNVRLDMAVDGDLNTVVESDCRPAPLGPDNPVGNAWTVHTTPLERELEAQRVADATLARTWTVQNEGVRNAHGGPVGYQLVPQSGVLPLLHPESPALGRALFATKHLWVTPYREGELFAAGAYPFQSGPGEGLPRYTAGNENVRNTDIVVWHTFIAHHVVRPEDWPVMPVTTASMHLRPVGFFDRNPALDLPLPHDTTSICHNTPGVATDAEALRHS
ncbi:primary-amine oxidase [Streptomyces bluensis]|uniref:primary-amine oxidase n=1 Tax=Streptomyces bluensis TaxID=33897 RepID=UPI001672EB66|nr:primary-amine oxidase [Streptomyces bluensis]GGZ64308.1 amine oxidase [Streptomyces bluensis]